MSAPLIAAAADHGAMCLMAVFMVSSIGQREAGFITADTHSDLRLAGMTPRGEGEAKGRSHGVDRTPQAAVHRGAASDLRFEHRHLARPRELRRALAHGRDELGVPAVSTHSFYKTVATLIDDAGLSARIGADHLGHAKVSMTQDRYMSRGRVHHHQVAELLEQTVIKRRINADRLRAPPENRF